MKRCPECRRDYYDKTLLYCLDDGSPLLEGPAEEASEVEPATMIFPETAAPGEGATRAQIHTTEQTEVLPNLSEPRVAKSLSSRKTLIAAAIGIILISVVGIGGYLIYGRGSSNQINSIAVMPFVNESGSEDVEYLSDGMTETLIGSLSNIPHLSVKARSTVFFYKGKTVSPKDLGKDLEVEAVLLGRVAERGKDLKLSLELVNTSNQDVIWFQQYARKKSDLVALQSEIAKDVSSKLKSRISGTDRAKVAKTSTTSEEAYRLYLRGRYFWNKRSNDATVKAIELFKAAADKDPNYALAYAGLADCYVLGLGTELNTKDRLSTGKAFAEKALALDSQLAEPHAALGAIHEQMWKWSEVESEYQRAIELNPNYATAYHWYSIFLQDFGRSDEAVSMIEKAQEIDPLSVPINSQASWVYQSRKNFDLAVKIARKSIELDPTSQVAHRALGIALLHQGRAEEAIEQLKKAVELSGRNGRHLGDLGFAYAVQGNRKEAIAIARELEENYANKGVRALSLAQVYSGLGDTDKAFDWLEESFRSGGTRLIEIRFHFQFESLRRDPRYKDLLKRMGLPES